jgi:DNA-binding CsgD family transcriptional regulator
VKLSELVATLSSLSDLGMGRPVERVLRQTVIAMRLAELADIDKGVQAATYYTSLLTWVGCAADTSDVAELFGDEMGLFADTHEGDLHGMTLAMFMVRHLGRGSSPVRRLSMTSRFVATAGRSVQQVMMSHCQSTGALAERLGLGDDVSQPLVQAFERWDGRGVPGLAGADELSLSARVVQLADYVEAFHFSGGTKAALDVARRKRGTGYARGLRRESIPMPGRILAVADVYQALGQPRPHRAALDQDQAAQVLRGEARAGRLDSEAVHAVLHGDRGRVRRRVELPGGLTRREAAVIVALARGRSNPQIAAELSISRKTVSAHLEHVYTKLGVSTRTEAALFAMQHGLMETPTSP